MTAVDIVLLVLIILGGATALFFFLRGMLSRSLQASKAYGVARQEARHEVQVNFLRGGFLLVLTLILLGIYGLTPGQEPASGQATATAAAPPTRSEAAPIETGVPAETGVTTESSAPAPSLTPSVQPSAVLITATVAPTATVTVAETPAATAVVNSPNGLWLREAPGGSQQVELIAHETTLELLPDRQTVDDLEWQQVRTPAGNEGWVAAEFLIYQ